MAGSWVVFGAPGGVAGAGGTNGGDGASGLSGGGGMSPGWTCALALAAALLLLLWLERRADVRPVWRASLPEVSPA
jgi:hypothetical protein